jgi:serpin B
MNKVKNGENLIISPLSIFQVLSLTANGAKGETQSEMIELLQGNSIEELNEINYKIISVIKDCTTVDIANAVMTRFSPLKTFTSIAEKYLATFDPLVSAEQVNDWCSNKTHGKINKIIDRLDANTVMILLNAVYFKGAWMKQFEKYTTKKLPFYNLGSKEKEVDTMNQIARFRYYEDKKVQAIQLDYEDDYMSALIILPSEGTDINNYINSISNSNDEFKTIIDGLKFAKVNLKLPKFELNFAEELNQILSDLGMYSAFSSADADFSGLREESNLFISKVIHKTYLKINEEGTEAAAVTAVIIANGMMPPDKPEIIYDMIVNRPFLFLLRNSRLPEGHDLLFMSKIEKIE